MGLHSLWEIVFFPRPKVGRWLSGIDYRRYGRPTPATKQNAGCIHVRL